MTEKEILARLETYKGQIATLGTERPAKVYKDVAHDVRKRSTFQMRLGLAYSNQAIVKEKHASGEVEKVGLPEGWKVLSAIAVETKWGKTLVRGAPTRNAHSVKKAVWLLDGKEVEKSAVEDMLLASEKKASNSDQDWIYIKPENLISLNGEPFGLNA